MYNCADCGREHSPYKRSDGESLCEACANKNYIPCRKCGRFVDPDEIHSNNECEPCSKAGL